MHDEAADQSELFALINEDPIKGAQYCREQIKADDAGVHVQRRRRIAEGYLISERLKADYELWRRFIADPFFDKDERIRKKDDTRFQYIVTRTVMIYLFSVLKSNNSMRNRMWRYARAIDHYAEQGVPPDQVVERIKADGGIEKVAASVGKGRLLEDEHADWAAEMRSRAEPDERVMGAAEEDAESEEEEPPEEPDAEPTVCLDLDEEGLRFVRKLKPGTELYFIASRLRIDDKGRLILRVSQIDNLAQWGLEYRRAMREWERAEEEEDEDDV